MNGLTEVDIKWMRDQLFFEGPERNRRLSRYWLLLPLAAVIASAGVVSDSTATVIGVLIVAPLMTPILGSCWQTGPICAGASCWWWPTQPPWWRSGGCWACSPPTQWSQPPTSRWPPGSPSHRGPGGRPDYRGGRFGCPGPV